jgi:hypothetical protein
MPVFIKPLVKSEMTQYRDGYGNNREWRKYNTHLNVSKVQLIPAPGNKTLTYRGLVKSEELRDPNNSIGLPKHKVTKKKVKKQVRDKKTGKMKTVVKEVSSVKRGDKAPGSLRHVNYLVTVQFHEVAYQDAEDKNFNQKWKVEGKDKFSRTPTIEKHPAMMKCQCRDFQFTWEKALAENGGLWPNNKWTKYVRLTSLAEYPRRNPKEKMGYCKHVATLLSYMHESGLLRNK